MMLKTKSFIIGSIVSSLLFGVTVYAAPYFRQEAGLVPITDSTYYLGTTTPSTIAWLSVVTDQLCLTGDVCRTTWPSGGSGTFSWTPTSYGVSTSTTLGFLQGFLSTASSTLQNFTFVNATGTSATTTNFHSSNTITGPGSFTVNSSGNVGIGTASPTRALDVIGYIQANQGVGAPRFMGNLGQNNDYADLNRNMVFNTYQLNSPIAGWRFTNTIASAQTSGQVTAFSISPKYEQTSGTAANTDFLINRTQTAVGSGAQLLADFQVSGVSKFNVTNTGQGYFAGSVGIGTTSPYAKLSVTGTGTGTSVNFLLANSANTPIFKVLDDGTATLTGSLTASALSAFSGGLTSYASSTIGDGTATGGLTISGGATTTGYFLAQNTTDSTTGFQIKDADGGTPILNIDTTNERVGIGTTTPSANLHVWDSNGEAVRLSSNNGAGVYLHFDNSNGKRSYIGQSVPGASSYGTNNNGLWLGAVDGAAGASAADLIKISNADTDRIAFVTASNKRMVIDSNGSVGIGTTSPWGKLSVAGSAGGTVPLFTVSSSTSAFATSTVFNIDSNGFVGIGRESPAYTLDVLAQGTGVIARFQSANATGCTLATDGTISCTSDERMKKNIEDLSYGLDTVMNLRPVLFNWNYEDDPTLKNLGFLAQDVELLIPKLVVTDEEGMKSLNTTGLIPVLVKAVQDLNNSMFSKITAWLSDAGNGIQSIVTKVISSEIVYSNEVHTENLCIKKSDGSEVCVNGDQLEALLGGGGQSTTDNFTTRLHLHR